MRQKRGILEQTF